MTSKEVTKLLHGRTIARVELNGGGKSNGGSIAQSVEIVLHGGGRLTFHVQEMPDAAEYGVSMIIHQAGLPALFTDRPGGRL